jgi:hypothetical protein
MVNSYHRSETEQLIFNETHNWTISEWRAFRNQFANYYEIRNECVNGNPHTKELFNKWKLEQIIEFKVKHFDLRKEGTNG